MKITGGETPRMIGVLLIRKFNDPVFDRLVTENIPWDMIPVLSEDSCYHLKTICTYCWRSWQSKYQIVSPSQFQSQEYEYAWN